MFSFEEKNKLYKIMKAIEIYFDYNGLLDYFFQLKLPLNYKKFTDFIFEKSYVSKTQYNALVKNGTNLRFYIKYILKDESIFDIWYINYLSEKEDIHFDSLYREFLLDAELLFSEDGEETLKHCMLSLEAVNFKDDEHKAYIFEHVISLEEFELIHEYLEALENMIEDESTLQVLDNLKKIIVK